MKRKGKICFFVICLCFILAACPRTVLAAEVEGSEYIETAAETTQDGDAGEYAAVVTETPSENYGFVTVQADVEQEIRDNQWDCAVEIENVETGEIYEFLLAYYNDYTTTAQRMTAGTYMVTSGGVIGDRNSQYPFVALTQEFTVQEGGSASLKLLIGDTDGSIAAARESEQESREAAAAESAAAELAAHEAQEEEEAARAARQSLVQRVLIFGGVFILVIAAIGLVVWLCMKHARASNWR